jgi:hypothetical protein
LPREVDFWFTWLHRIDHGGRKARLGSRAHGWRAGKRWRPFLAVAAQQALNETATALPDDPAKW